MRDKLILFAILPLSISAKAKTENPNVLLIVADDMGFSDLGCYGSEIMTPNLDKLAAQGLRFNNFHNTGKSFPSRAALLTGLYAQQSGYHKSYKKPFRNAVTLGDVLRDAGYTTLFAGKHHGAENPHDMGFDRNYGLKDGCCNYFNPGVQREGEGKPAQKSATRKWAIDGKEYAPYSPQERDFYTTDYYTNYALKWLEEYSDDGKPFFLYLAYNAPHDPLQAWGRDIERYKGRYDGGYEEIREARYKRQLELNVIDENCKLSQPTHTPWSEVDPREKRLESRRMEVYAAMIDCMDQNIGRVVKYLEKSGEIDNTIIIFVSDNGCSAQVVKLKENNSGDIGSMTRWESLGRDWANVSNTPFTYYKTDSYEGGINTPMIINWGDGLKSKGRVTNTLGHFIDIMATLVDITGAQYPTIHNGESVTPMAGESLRPLIDGDLDWRRQTPLFWEWGSGAAVGCGDWKIVRKGAATPWSLYNRAEDPSETHDMSADYAERVESMSKMFSDWKVTTLQSGY